MEAKVRSLSLTRFHFLREGILMWLAPFGILILGLVATILFQAIRGGSQRALRAKAYADLSELETALDRYHTDNGSYPSKERGLSALVSAPGTEETPSNSAPSGYLQSIPRDPWGDSYFYRSDQKSYTLKSLGADGAEGGSGDNTDIDARQR